MTLEVVFAAMHRDLGVAVGQHLGDLLTGALTVAERLVRMAFLAWAAWLVLLGAALLLGLR